MNVKYPVTTLASAYQHFLDGLSMQEIATKLDVPLLTIRTWSRDEQWSAKRREARKELAEQATFEVDKLKASRLVAVVRRQLDAMEKLDKRAVELLDKSNIGSETLLNIARSLQASNAALSKLLGLEKPQNATSVNVLVQTGFSPAPASVTGSPSAPKTITVTEDPDDF